MTAGDALRRIVARLDAARIPYFLTGSFAASAHGLLRTTFDFDIVIDRTYVETWAQRLGVDDLWRKVLDGMPPV